MPPALIHCTDLFRPHEDPDDHWDLATGFALARAGRLDLRAVLIDHPPPGHPGLPDGAAIRQMNHISGLDVPWAAGSPEGVDARGGVDAGHLLIDILETSEQPVSILIGGSCQTLAAAVARSPDLFRERCSGVYLNAGSGTRDPARIREAEYNVRLNAEAFTAMFNLPCPLFWMPCFETTPPEWKVEEWGTWFSFCQQEIFDVLSPRIQNFFLGMLEKRGGSDWRGQLEETPDARSLAHFGSLKRNMWCTAGFFHAAGMAVSQTGELISPGETGPSPVYTFTPIEAICGDSGFVDWHPTSGRTEQSIFQVLDRQAYAGAMTSALRSILKGLD